MELAALERLKLSHRLIMGKWCLQASSFTFDRIFVKLAGNQDSHKISDEFEFWLDQISHFGATCPCGRIKFSVDILWNLQVQLTFQTLEFFVTFSRELWGLEDWNLVHTWTVGRCIMHTGIRLLLLICPFISSFFFLSNFQQQFLVTIFSGTVRPRILKLDTNVASGQMSHVYRNQAVAAYSSLYFFIFLSLQFSTLKYFVTLFSGTMMPRRLKIGTRVDSGQIYLVYQNQAAAAYSSL